MSVRHPMRLVYVAGPFRGRSAWEIADNTHEAERWALRVAEAGAMPVVPHSLGRSMFGTRDESFWLEGTLALLGACQGALFIPRWTESSGARAEHVFAEANRIEIFGAAHLRDDTFRRWALTGVRP